ncbi:MAG: hypothetical protein A2428_07270 [Bdellovibrionales bacterium RIFOXYC1_FULL_54_43]|nr:MAG: hypothetical protein A2428_07270 [Bdellovibrionales bacterium RIFOXYC1_FULL_54_43]OFZ85835.1 MAG: hypothetical protein A2603_13640 [Bdellovibrionales bacterium RIFOXYD1_FULL_55_31]
MSEIVLSTITAKYVHPSLGLRYLLANMGSLRERTRLLEFTLSTPSSEIASRIIAEQPKIVGLGVYIWNASQTLELIKLLKRQDPTLKIVLGGPEISYEFEHTELFNRADYLICGEADLKFGELCGQILKGDHSLQGPPKVFLPPSPDLHKLTLPYDFYTDEDLKNRLVYVEASRGCPFGCEFCLSSRDPRVRSFELESFLKEMRSLLARGARRFKFVDRTFNLNPKTIASILGFLLEYTHLGIFSHFEIVPDRLSEDLIALAAKFPRGVLQFEVGVQTLNAEVANRIGRKQNSRTALRNIQLLRQKTEVLLHADLIFGLPGEGIESIASGFNELMTIGPHELQVGILKKLKGTSLARHDEFWGMEYSKAPPFEVIQTKLLDRQTMDRLKIFGKYWELFYNRGQLNASMAAFIQASSADGGLFHSFLCFSDWLHSVVQKTNHLSLEERSRRLGQYLLILGIPKYEVLTLLKTDYLSVPGRKARDLL